MADREVETASGQEDGGWEDLTHNLPSGDPVRPKPAKPEKKVEATPDAQAAQEPTQAPKETPEPAAQPAAEATDVAAPEPVPQQGQQTQPKKYKLDGSEYELADLTKPDMLERLVTRAQQQPHFQKLSEERAAELEAIRARQQQIESAFTQWQMQQQAAAVAMQQRQAQQAAAATQAQRPDSPNLQAYFKPRLDQWLKEGRISEYEATEHGGILAEAMFEFDNLHSQLAAAHQKIAQMEGILYQSAQTQAQQVNQARKQSVRAELVNMGDVFSPLQDDNNWNSLLERIQQKITATNGFYDPPFTAEMLADEWIAMNRQLWLTATQKLREQEAGRMQVAQAATAGDAGPVASPRQTQRKVPLKPGDDEGWGDLTAG